ncbi:hypothetical protein M404DRAFT_713784 [Pisolithus tinctorius Marx 270]|uniref:Uncharacterized protein n=1 Tax=Pisolithus tinctorius Marx 270 TaxID=870435 RepID=A0A0C3P3U1_PISTI|nr:hypothetical protein M404DRAFT_713784 [Pisolithus tinctorius Marx 270]
MNWATRLPSKIASSRSVSWAELCTDVLHLMGTPKQKVRGSSKSLSQLGFREQEERKKRNRILFLDSIGHNHQASGLRYVFRLCMYLTSSAVITSTVQGTTHENWPGSRSLAGVSFNRKHSEVKLKDMTVTQHLAFPLFFVHPLYLPIRIRGCNGGVWGGTSESIGEGMKMETRL